MLGARGALVLALAIGFLPSGPAFADFIFSDPVGDAVGGLPAHDILSVAGVVTPGVDITITVTFGAAVSAPSGGDAATLVQGFIDLDTDQNTTTNGATDYGAARGLAGKSGLGVDFYLDLTSEAFTFDHVGLPGFVDVYETMGNTIVGTAAISYSGALGGPPHTYAVTIPLSLLGGDDGLLDAGVFAANIAPGITDEAPDAVASVVPEPASGTLLAIGGMALLGYYRRRQPTAHT
jgi:hypothetical protein